MKYVGIDLHKKTIVICVVNKDRTVLQQKKFLCLDVGGIVAWFEKLGTFRFVVEATASYEWLVQVLEPLAQDWVLAHPGKKLCRSVCSVKMCVEIRMREGPPVMGMWRVSLSCISLFFRLCF